MLKLVGSKSINIIYHINRMKEKIISFTFIYVQKTLDKCHIISQFKKPSN